MENNSIKSLNIPTEEFLNCFFSVNEIINFRVFDDRKSGAFQGAKLPCENGKFGRFETKLKEHNAKNRGIFFVVNSGGNTDSEITRINAQFVEMDDGSFEEQMTTVKGFKLEPSLIVKTRKSLHCYWLISKGKVENFRNIQQALVKEFQGDPACVNESRVLRVPGFNHCKEEPLMVEIIKFNPELRYTQEQLLEVLPKITPQKSVEELKQSSKRTGIKLLSRCDFIKHCQDKPEDISEQLWYAMVTNLAEFEGGVDLIHKISGLYSNYSKEETNGKIEHYFDSKTKPITCKTICEKGFKCPKFETGECKCKSPAGLAYKPYTIAELKELLASRCKGLDVLENIQSAIEYVRSYMYNVQGAEFETFVECVVAKFYDLKANETRRLVKEFKDIVKDYKNKREKNIEGNGELAEWYEPTENGVRFLSGVLSGYLARNEKTFFSAENFYEYDSGVYKPITDNMAKRKVRNCLIEKYATMNQINDTTSQWEIMIEKRLNELNSNPFIINCRNGLYNVLDDSFKPHTPDYLSTVQVNPSYDPSAKCPVFMKYLKDSFEEPEIKLVQEILGYLLVPISKAQKCFVFTGIAHAGKSVLLDMITETLLGSELVSHIMWQQLGDRFKTAEIFGKMANTFSDLPTENIDENSIFKAITGQDYITAEEKNKKPFSFKPYARLVFSCNEVPKNYSDRSEGFYRRLIIIRFEKAVPIKERDADLKDKLQAEADGIMNFAIAGLKRLIANKYVFSETEKTIMELEKYRKESNSALVFLDECCDLDQKAVCSSSQLYDKYQEFCKNNGLRNMSQPKFNSAIELSKPFVFKGKDKVSRRTIWNGIRILT